MVKVIIDDDDVVSKLPMVTLAQIKVKMEANPDPTRPPKPNRKWHTTVTLNDGNRYGVNCRSEEGDVHRIISANRTRIKKIRIRH